MRVLAGSGADRGGAERGTGALRLQGLQAPQARAAWL